MYCSKGTCKVRGKLAGVHQTVKGRAEKKGPTLCKMKHYWTGREEYMS